MTLSTQVSRLRRAEASAYLSANYGIVRAPTTLAKLACVGGGPEFQYANRTPLYPVDELDKWAESILSPIVQSSSQRAA